MADIFLTNTLTRKKEKFKPINRKEVKIYTCGPTVYRDIHIGNLRSYLMADILKRVLLYNGFSVKHIKNITDVGHMRSDPTTSRLRGASETAAFDPVIAEALKKGKTPHEIAKEYTKKFRDDEKALNILPADNFPKATEHITEMIELTKGLIEKGLAYETNGTVYYNVKKFKNYGQLSGNTLDKMDKLLEAVRVSSESDKKKSVDFALWKKADEGHILQWDSPWGKGYPGWHIECSAMSMKHLGDHFDIHTGGEDNIFPHHENEIAQSEGSTGKPFVNIWLHGGWLLIDSKKMARREGETFTISEIVEKGYNPLSFRYLTLMAHYRSRLNFSWDSLKQAETTLNNLYRWVSGLGQGFGDKNKKDTSDFEQNFLEAINDDMDMPKALDIVWQLTKSDVDDDSKLKSLLKFDKVLGLDIQNAEQMEVKNISDRITKIEIEKLLKERKSAREKDDFKLSDKIRDEIKAKGYEVVDSKDGQKLKRIIN
ncbi:cysteine--tRNA ligase [Patescibacteria group bacterium]|nr:cysteine--tRNA ligase [Patescibacteria group bacterium]